MLCLCWIPVRRQGNGQRLFAMEGYLTSSFVSCSYCKLSSKVKLIDLNKLCYEGYNYNRLWLCHRPWNTGYFTGDEGAIQLSLVTPMAYPCGQRLLNQLVVNVDSILNQRWFNVELHFVPSGIHHELYYVAAVNVPEIGVTNWCQWLCQWLVSVKPNG